jgi:hypothetical protein
MKKLHMGSNIGKHMEKLMGTGAESHKHIGRGIPPESVPSQKITLFDL